MGWIARRGRIDFWLSDCFVSIAMHRQYHRMQFKWIERTGVNRCCVDGRWDRTQKLVGRDRRIRILGCRANDSLRFRVQGHYFGKYYRHWLRSLLEQWKNKLILFEHDVICICSGIYVFLLFYSDLITISIRNLFVEWFQKVVLVSGCLQKWQFHNSQPRLQRCWKNSCNPGFLSCC